MNYEKMLVSTFYRNVECVNFYEFYGDIVYTELNTLTEPKYISNIPVMIHDCKSDDITMLTLYGASTGMKYLVNKANVDREFEKISNVFESDFNTLKDFIGEDPLKYYLYGVFCKSMIKYIKRSKKSFNCDTPVHIFNVYRKFCDTAGISDEVPVPDRNHSVIVELIKNLRSNGFDKIKTVKISAIDEEHFEVGIEVPPAVRKIDPLFPKTIYTSIFTTPDVFASSAFSIYASKLIGDDYINKIEYELEKIKLKG